MSQGCEGATIAVRVACGGAVAVASLCLPVAVLAVDAGPFSTAAERTVAEARQAREQSDFARANALLQDVLAGAEELDTDLEGAATHELGLLLRDQGKLVEAEQTLRDAAELSPRSPARVDRAGVLVELGRWPEAVVVLKKAFDEQGMALPVQEVTSDPRFARLARLQPYRDLVAEVGAEQAGPFGRLLLRLERLLASTRSAERSVERLGQWVELVRRLAEELSTAVVLMVVLGLLATFAIAQTRLVGAPWTLLAGMLVAAVCWHVLARVGTDGASTGLSTIATGFAVVFGMWLAGAQARLWKRRRRARLLARQGPFASETLRPTLDLVDEVSRLGHRLLSVRVQERSEIAAELQSAAGKLRDRLAPMGDRTTRGPDA